MGLKPVQTRPKTALLRLIEGKIPKIFISRLIYTVKCPP